MLVCRNDSLKFYHLSQYSTESARIVPKSITIRAQTMRLSDVPIRTSQNLERVIGATAAALPVALMLRRKTAGKPSADSFRRCSARMLEWARNDVRKDRGELEEAQAEGKIEEGWGEAGEGVGYRHARRSRVPLLQEALLTREAPMQQRQGRQSESAEGPLASAKPPRSTMLLPAIL